MSGRGKGGKDQEKVAQKDSEKEAKEIFQELLNQQFEDQQEEVA